VPAAAALAAGLAQQLPAADQVAMQYWALLLPQQQHVLHAYVCCTAAHLLCQQLVGHLKLLLAQLLPSSSYPYGVQ
jgi:hypothetical protein